MVEQIQEHSFSAAAEKVKEGAHEFKEAISETASNTFSEYACQATNMITENPYKSVLIAFGIGALAGMFFLRR